MTHIYFIKPVDMDGPIKIGRTDNLSRRLVQLSGWSPFPLELLTAIEADGADEERFHAAFIEHHVRLEWFNPHRDILDTIESINAGTFDLDTLPYACGPINGLAERKAAWVAIDYEYHELWRAYRCRDTKIYGWLNDVIHSAAFARASHQTKLRRLERIRNFMATYRPDQSAAA